MIFGGFVQGSRTNECYLGTKTGNTLNWKVFASKSATAPCVRASHSCVFYNNKCYIFGGSDDDNNKLNDLWELDMATEQYKQIEIPADSAPSPRSGHSANVYNG